MLPPREDEDEDATRSADDAKLRALADAVEDLAASSAGEVLELRARVLAAERRLDQLEVAARVQSPGRSAPGRPARDRQTAAQKADMTPEELDRIRARKRSADPRRAS